MTCCRGGGSWFCRVPYARLIDAHPSGAMPGNADFRYGRRDSLAGRRFRCGHQQDCIPVVHHSLDRVFHIPEYSNVSRLDAMPPQPYPALPMAFVPPSEFTAVPVGLSRFAAVRPVASELLTRLDIAVSDIDDFRIVKFLKDSVVPPLLREVFRLGALCRVEFADAVGVVGMRLFQSEFLSLARGLGSVCMPDIDIRQFSAEIVNELPSDDVHECRAFQAWNIRFQSP